MGARFDRRTMGIEAVIVNRCGFMLADFQIKSI